MTCSRVFPVTADTQRYAQHTQTRGVGLSGAHAAGGDGGAEAAGAEAGSLPQVDGAAVIGLSQSPWVEIGESREWPFEYGEESGELVVTLPRRVELSRLLAAAMSTPSSLSGEIIEARRARRSARCVCVGGCSETSGL